MKNYYILLALFLVGCGDKGSVDHLDADVSVSEMLLTDKAPEESAAHKAFVEKFTIDRVSFGFDKYSVSAEAKEYLSKVVEYLKINLDLRVEVQGNCDRRGSAAYNIALGEHRANAVRKFLIANGIPESRVSAVSFGSRILVQGDDEDAYAKNRVGILVIK